MILVLTLFAIKPDYKFLKVFGCACYPLMRPYNQHKFDLHSSSCLFLGYDPHRRGYLCLTTSDKLHVSRNVLFNESLFPYSLSANPFLRHSTSDSSDIYVSSTAPLTVVSIPHDTTPAPHTSIPTSPRLTESPLPSVPSPVFPTKPSPAPTTNTHPMLTRAKAGISKPKLFHTSISHNISKPSNYKQAMANPLWFRAMQTEYDALLHNNTWTLTLLPPNANLVGCKGVFKRKFNVDGSLERYKARLVAKGFHQREGLDFTDTFSPVIKQTTIRIVFTIALSSCWPIHQLDINNAFLHGELDSPVYMQQAP